MNERSQPDLATQTLAVNTAVMDRTEMHYHRIMPFAWLITVLVTLNSVTEYFFGFAWFAFMQILGTVLSLLLLLLLHRRLISVHAAVAVYMSLAAAMFIYEFQFDSMSSNLTFYAVISFLLFHVLGLRLGGMYCVGLILFVLGLCSLVWFDVLAMAHNPAEVVDFVLILGFVAGCAFFMEREREKCFMQAEGAACRLHKSGQALQEKLNYISKLEKLDGALLQPSYEHAINSGLHVLLESLSCSRTCLLHVRSDGDIWHTPYEQALPAYRGAMKASVLMSVDEPTAVLFNYVDAAYRVFVWDQMVDCLACLKPYQVKAQMMIKLITPGQGGWYLCVQQCDQERHWQAIEQQLLMDCAIAIQAVLGQYLLHHELAGAARNAQRSSQAKSDFLATMSHELRTPLHGIIGMQKMLAKDASYLKPEHRKLLDLAQHSTHILSSLIDDVLDLSKIEAGKIEIKSSAFDLPKCLQDALLPFLIAAHEKQLGIVLKYERIPVCINGDETRIRQVLLNLIGNAVKFTKSGQVTLSAAYKNDHLTLTISDTGIGIADSDLETLFEPFVQLSNAAECKGTGLGTTISHRFISLMYGHIDVSSEVGVGTTFHIELPLAAMDQRRVSKLMGSFDLLHGLEPVHACSIPMTLESKRVLLAEDDPIARKIAVDGFNQCGLTVDIAEHGLEAWEKFRQQDYDLLLTDIRMPGLDGLELTQRIRQYEKELDSVPILIIGLSAHVLEEVAQECLAVGMDDFISKPIDPSRLIQRLQ